MVAPSHAPIPARCRFGRKPAAVFPPASRRICAFAAITLSLLLTSNFVTPLAYAEESARSVRSDSEAIKRDRKIRSLKALKACSELPGYQELQKSFRIGDATLGFISSMPESLFVELHSTKPKVIDTVWWWNPLAHKKPSLNWRDFLTAYAAAERVASKHLWLAKLKGLSNERTLGLQLLGTRVGVIDDHLDFYYLPAWRHAGMAGRPAYCLLAHRGDHSRIEFIFSEEDDRAFVRSTSTGEPNPQCALDRLDVSWHPRGKRGEPYSQYAVVERDGRLRVHTFVADER
jgi:hypothetical protein